MWTFENLEPLLLIAAYSLFLASLIWYYSILHDAKLNIEVTIVEDSFHERSFERVTTMVLRHPRYIHSELLKHRWFACSSMSSRAVPSKKMRERILRCMAVPAEWGANQPGMQAFGLVRPWRAVVAHAIWCTLGILAVFISWVLDKLGLHKQIVNRVTEPWSYTTSVVTCTYAGYLHFLALRLDPAAEPAMRQMALMVQTALKTSRPRTLKEGQWHLPFVTQFERDSYVEPILLNVSAARCGRTSYLNHDRSSPVVQDDLNLAKKLSVAEPMHATPFEHQVQMTYEHPDIKWSGCLHSRNLKTYRARLEYAKRHGVPVEGV